MRRVLCAGHRERQERRMRGSAPCERIDKRLCAEQDDEVLDGGRADAVGETEAVVAARHLELLYVARVAHAHHEGAALAREADEERAGALRHQETVHDFVVRSGVQPALRQ